MTKEYRKENYLKKLDFSYQSCLGMWSVERERDDHILHALGSSAFCFF